MTNNQKAIAHLEQIDINAVEDNGTVYIVIGDTYLEIAEYEINFQARQYDALMKED